MKPKRLKTEADYEAALDYVEGLMDAEPGSPEEDELEVFALLIEAYEEEHYSIELPDPVEAIKFRMEQQGLSQKDMVPYLGSQSRVSEVLNRKRPLSLSMIRALHEGLGIPAEALLREPREGIPDQPYDPQEYPFNEMFRRGYFAPFHGSLREARLRAEELLAAFFSVFGGEMPRPVLCRRTDREPDVNALVAWQAQALRLAQQEVLPDYDPEAVTDSALRALVRQSYFSSGPRNARELLNSLGIHLVVLPHMPKTYLDGAASMAPWGRPVVGLTLRYDRLDNFWFTLLHELAHVRLHLERGVAFFDETQEVRADPDDPCECDAHAFAQEMLISAEVWERKEPALLPDPSARAVVEVAEELRISPAIVAGRVRWETQDYGVLGSLVGANRVREQFEEYEGGSDQWRTYATID
jgi:HTH-type transcriptional regulator / antitoxin HigA